MVSTFGKRKLNLLLIAAIAFAAVFCMIASDTEDTSADVQIGDTFQAKTVEDVTITYVVASLDPLEAYVNEMQTDIGDAETITIPSAVTYDKKNFTVTGVCNNAFYYQSSLTTVNLPSTVTVIGSYAFEGTSISSIILPSDLTTIYTAAFACTPLTSVSLPDSVTELKDEAFTYCTDLTSVTFGSGFSTLGANVFLGSGVTSFTVSPDNTKYSSADGILLTKDGTGIVLYPAALTGSYTVGAGITSIGDYSFTGCTITGVTLSAGVTSVGKYAFYQCYDLTSVTDNSTSVTIGDYAFAETGLTGSITIGSNVASMGTCVYSGCTSVTSAVIDVSGVINFYTFMDCSSLQSVTIGKNVTYIDGSSFRGCTSLETVSVSEDNASFYVTDNVLYTVAESKKLLVYYPAGRDDTSFTVPSDVCWIYSYAFTDSRLTSISAEGDLEYIATYVFYNCTELISVTLGAKVDTIGDYAFQNCTSLGSISVTGVSKIGAGAFKNCTSLTSVSLPAGLITINDYTFADCTSLQSIELGTSLQTIGAYAFSGSGLTSVTVPDNVVTIGDFAFYYCTSLRTVNGCDGVTSVGIAAFAGCFELETVSFTNESLVFRTDEESNGTFMKCMSLTSVTLPSTLETIGKSMFFYCSSLTEITIPSTVTSIAMEAFGESGLTSIELPSGVLTIGNYAFSGCKDLASVTGLGSVTSIGDEVFYECGSLKSIEFGTSLLSIGEYAFFKTGLTSVSVPDNVTSIGAGCFKSCKDLATASLGTGITAIPDELFCNCDALKNFTINEGVVSIGSEVFYGCDALESIQFNASNCADLAKDASAFAMTSPFAVAFGSTVVRIPGYLFFSELNNGANVSTVTIGENVESAGDYAFAFCTGIQSIYFNSNHWTGSLASCLINCIPTDGISVYIGNNVTAVPEKLLKFEGSADYRPKIVKITIGTGVTSIGNYAFAGTSDVKDIIFNAIACDDLTADSHAFYDCGSSAEVLINTGVTKVPAYLFYESNSTHSADVNKLGIAPDVASIGLYAFCNLKNLTEINYYAVACGDLDKDNHAFDYCGQSGEGISLYIMDGVTKVPAYLFRGTSTSAAANVKVLELSADITSIGDEAFCNLKNLTQIDYGITHCDDLDADAGVFDYCGTGVTDGITLNIASNVTNIPACLFFSPSSYVARLTTVSASDDAVYTINGAAFSYTPVVTVDVGDKCTSIGTSAFAYCTKLKTLTIGSDVASLGEDAFKGCTALTQINFDAKSCISPEHDVFSNCGTSGSGISVVFGESVAAVPDKLFYVSDTYHPKITSVEFDDDMTSVGSYAFYSCLNLQSLTFSESLLTIGDHSFYGCKVPSIVIPDSVTIIGEEAFYGSTASSVTIGAGVTSIGSKAFANMLYVTELQFNAVACTNFTSESQVFYKLGRSKSGVAVSFGNTAAIAVPDYMLYNASSTSSETAYVKTVSFGTAVSIGQYAFYNCTALTDIPISASVESIGENAFKGCTSLTSYTVDEENAYFNSDNGVLYDSVNKILLSYPTAKSETSYTVLDGTLTLAFESFLNNTKLKTLTISDSVTSTSDGAVKGCTGIRQITVSKNLTSVGDNDFEGLTFYKDDDTEITDRSELIGYTFIGTSTKLIKHITIFFDSDGGSDVSPIIQRAGTSVSKPDDPTKTGYTFSKWQLNGEEYTFTVMPDENITLKAVWTVNTYDMTYSCPDETDTEIDSTVKEVTFDDVYGELSVPVREGYIFSGWFLEDTFENEITAETVVKTASDHSIYAKWTPIEYTVTFYGNGETEGEMERQSFVYDVAQDLSANAYIKTGYSFAGWARTADGEKEFDDKQEVKNLVTVSGGNLKLYAKWTANTYTVTLNANGGPKDGSVTATYDSVLPEFEALTRTGYTLIGYFISAESDVLVIDRDGILQSSIEDISDENGKWIRDSEATFYAKWAVNGYTITYSCPDETDTEIDGTQKNVTFDAAYGELPSPARLGYTFSGWFLEDTFENEVTSETVVKTADNHTLYAKWVPITYTVTFHGNKETGGTMDAQTHTYDAELALSTNAFTRTGYTFAGWARTAFGEIEFDDEEIVKNLKSVQDENVDLYAIWTANTYTITLDKNGGSKDGSVEVTFDSRLPEFDPLTKRGYTLTGYFLSAESDVMVIDKDGVLQRSVEGISDETGKWIKADDATFYAHWSPKGYTVTYSCPDETDTEIDGTTKGVTYDAAYGKLAVPARTGYLFSGWFLEARYTTEITADTTVTTADDHKLYAKWTPITYTVTFLGNGSTGGAMDPQSFTYDKSQHLAANEYLRKGYTFAGWSRTAEGSTEFEDEESVKNLVDVNEGNIDLYAVWTANSYTVTLDKNGGDKDETIENVIFDSKLPAFNAVTKTGYSLTGYYLTASSDVMVIDKDGVLQNSIEGISDENGNWIKADDATFYAQWSPNTYAATYDCPAETGTSIHGTTKDVVYDAAYGELAVPVRTGYTFNGWFIDYLLTEEITKDTIVKTCNAHTLYAKWTPITYTVTFYGNGETEGSMVPQTFTYDQERSLSSNKFAKTGHTFYGWALTPEGEKEYNNKQLVKNLLSEEGANLDLYALWTVQSYNVTLDKNTGSKDGSVTATFNSTLPSFEALTKNGYSLTGYFLSPKSDTMVIDKDGVLQNSVEGISDENGKWIKAYDAIFYAQWEVNGYTVTYSCPDETDTSVNGTTKAVTFDSSYGALAEPVRAGYGFSGWFLEDTFENEITRKSKVSIAENHTLYAKWTPSQYTLKLNANGGTVSPSKVTVTYDSAYGELPEASWSGYEFLGWFTDATAGEKILPETVCKTAKDHEYFAHWSARSYNVTYYVDDDMVYEDTYDCGATVTVRDRYQIKGYTVSPWSIIGTFKMPAYDVDITATKTVNKYDITYLSEGNVFYTYKGEYGSTIVLPENDPVKESTTTATYKFTGWNGYTEGMTVDDHAYEFTAEYSSSTRYYDAVFMNLGQMYKTFKLEYNQTIPTPTKDPTRASSENFDYRFTGWEGYIEGTKITSNVSYDALYLSSVKELVITDTTASVPAGKESVVELSASKISDIKSKANSGEITRLDINLETGTISLDAESIKSLSDATALVSLLEVQDHSVLPEEIAKRTEGRTVFSVNMGDNHTFGGKVTVTVKYQLKDGESADSIEISYYSDDGACEKYPCSYSDGKATFTSGHLSYYAVTVKDPVPADDNSVMVYLAVAGVIIVVLALIVLFVIRKRRVASKDSEESSAIETPNDEEAPKGPSP